MWYYGEQFFYILVLGIALSSFSAHVYLHIVYISLYYFLPPPWVKSS